MLKKKILVTLPKKCRQKMLAPLLKNVYEKKILATLSLNFDEKM
jgi:hypothetical protein